jgi:pimeloyl-ACP methyl ester carboxylesterase
MEGQMIHGQSDFQRRHHHRVRPGGEGPPLILVDGALCYRASGPNGPLAELLRQHFTVFTYDRRGRGDSGDTAPFAVEREVEDLQALIEEAGGSAYVCGISSGAVLALDAANRGLAIEKLALYEAPFVVDDTRPPVPEDHRARLDQLVASDRRGEAVKLFMSEGVRVPAIFVTMMRFMPAWPKLKAVAHTLPYDTASWATPRAASRYRRSAGPTSRPPRW